MVIKNNKAYEIKVQVEELNTDTLNVTTNGQYTPTSPVDAFDEVNVNVQPNLTTLNATSNDTYTPTSPVQGYSEVTVNVSTPTEPFYVYDMSGTANTMTIKQVVDWGVVPAIEVFYSYDKSTWTSLGTTSSTPLTLALPVDGSKVYLRATCDRWGGLNHGECNNLNCSGEFGVGGNIMSLLYGANYEGATFTSDNAHAFQFLFGDLDYAKCKDAGDLILPSNTIDHCYNRMFMGCKLYRIPKLPATTLTERCYAGMFQYSNGGTLMTPVLPATTLATGCYEFMFYSGYSIKTIITYAQDISASNCLDAWLDQTSSTGEFYNLGGATFPSGVSGIPSGWTEHSTL